MPDDALQNALASLLAIEEYRLRARQGDVFGPATAAKALGFILRELMHGRLHGLGRSKVFWSAPPDFAALAGRYCLAVVDSMRQQRWTKNGSVADSETRMRYVLRRANS